MGGCTSRTDSWSASLPMGGQPFSSLSLFTKKTLELGLRSEYRLHCVHRPRDTFANLQFYHNGSVYIPCQHVCCCRRRSASWFLWGNCCDWTRLFWNVVLDLAICRDYPKLHCSITNTSRTQRVCFYVERLVYHHFAWNWISIYMHNRPE